MISVIIPVYNLKPYFNEAIESVISQSFTDLEIILVDDGSTDGCGELCDHYAALDPRIKVIHQKNRGLSGARNAGLDVCKGDFIAFLDADDAYHPDALSRAMEAIFSDHNQKEALQAIDCLLFNVGCGICLHQSGYENNSITTPEDRLREFGQNDHLRVFGKNSAAILESFGFEVREICGSDCDSKIKPVIGPADYDFNKLWILTTTKRTFD